MKVEKFLKILMAITCMMVMMFSFNSCSDDDDTMILITYTAKGSLSASGSDALDAIFGVADYTDAITRVLGDSYTTTEKDSEVVSACDAVFQKHRTNHPTWKGQIEIEKSKIETSGNIVSNTIIKTYKYE
ncbi:MAG: hypothetical protein IJD84_05085 [Parabacteroides sp.]|nr:hypothetical protein [Parabacteroides sp.]